VVGTLASYTFTANGSRNLVANFTSQQTAGPWAKNLGGAGTEYGLAMASASNGDSLVAGVFTDTVDFTGNGSGVSGLTKLTSAGLYDAFVARYSSAGVLQWVKQFGGTDNEIPKCITLDGSGNIFLGGSFVGGSLVKLSSQGDLLWTRGPVGASFASVATDSQGNVVVTGSFVADYNSQMDFGDNHPLYSQFTSTDAFLAKYSAAGTCLWAKDFYNGGDTEYGTGVAVDRRNDNILLAGYAFAGIDLGGGILVNNAYGAYGFVGKFSPAGDHLFSRVFGTKAAGSSTGPFTRVKGMALDSNGDIAIIGEFNGPVDFGGSLVTASAANYNLFVAKYSGVDFGYRWASIATGKLTSAGAVAIDAQNNIVVTGGFQSTSTFGTVSLTTSTSQDNDVYVAKYSATGGLSWAARFGGTGGDYGNGITVDASGNPVVTGSYQGTGTFGTQLLTCAGGVDGFLMRLNP